MMPGLIGKKLGMTQVFEPTGELVPVTVLRAGPCTVVQTRTKSTDGYVAIQLGFGEKKAQRATKAYRTHCLRAGKGVFTALREFEPVEAVEYRVGQEVKVEELFKVGDRVDVTGT